MLKNYPRFEVVADCLVLDRASTWFEAATIAAYWQERRVPAFVVLREVMP
jgi:hypothetical protein